jgi:tetratricopeptide (TPR) repeat protein
MADPAQIRALLDRGVERHRSGDFQAARALYEQVLALDPAEPNSLTNIGTICCQMGDMAGGISFLERSLAAKPQQPHALSNLASALVMTGRVDAARLVAERAAGLQPDYAEVWTSLGNIHGELGDADGALEAYARALDLNPQSADAQYRMGVCLYGQRRLEAALASLDKALAVAPGFALAGMQRGHVLRELTRYDEALAAYDDALAMTAETTIRRDILSNKAIALYELRRIEDALAAFGEAWAIDPDFSEAPCNIAVIQIATGRYDEGWRAYEWRWKDRAFKDKPNPYGQAPWLGQRDIAGKTLLITAEQGAGDTLQMLRYAPVLAGMGARVLIAAQESLADLAASVAGVSAVFTEGQTLPPWDEFIPTMSLPHALGTQPDTVPCAVPYLSAGEPAKSVWAKRLGPRTKPRIGLAWSGNRGHANDHNRSLPLGALEPLLALDAAFVSLQVDYRAGDMALLALHGVRDFSGEIASFTDTAGLIDQLDLVISVDTAVAHLAGALAKPLWLLLPYTADYRWHLDGADTAWYPTATLVRQDARRRWEPVVARLTAMGQDWLKRA